MRRFLFAAVVALTLGVFAGVAQAVPWMGNLVVRDSAVWPDGRPGNYGTAKYFIDENANETIPIAVRVEIWAGGQPPGAVEAQVFTNLNRRQFAKVFETVGASGMSDSYTNGR